MLWWGQKNSPTYPQQNRPSQNAPKRKGAHTFTAYAWYVRLYSSNTDSIQLSKYISSLSPISNGGVKRCGSYSLKAVLHFEYAHYTINSGNCQYTHRDGTKSIYTAEKKARKMQSRPVVQTCRRSAMTKIARWHFKGAYILRLGLRLHSLNGKLWTSFGWWKEWPSFQKWYMTVIWEYFAVRTFRNDYHILISKWWVWPSFEKAIQIHFRFMTDLSVHFQMTVRPSFRNERGHFYMTIPAPSFRKQGGFTSCHIGKDYHLFYHWKRGIKWGIQKRKIILKSFRNFIISESKSFFKIFDR